MKASFSAAVAAFSIFAPLVQATWSKDAAPFSTPDNCNNTCSPQQQAGFNWTTHPAGKPADIGNFSFSNCQVQSAASKRDGLSRRADGGNCLAGAASPSSGPGMQSSSDGFSVSEIHLSTDNDQQPLECHYFMPDNSTCKTQHTCGQNVTVIKNQQCGGATSMSVAVPSQAKTSTCSVSIHSVSFACGTPSYTPTVKPTSTPTTAPAQSTTSTPSSAPAVPLSTGATYTPGPTGAPSASSVIYGNSTTQQYTTYTHTTTTSCSSGQVISSTLQTPTIQTVTGTSTVTITSCAATVTDCPARQTPQTSVATYTTTSSCSSGYVFSTTLTAPSVITTSFPTSTPVAPPPYPAVPQQSQDSTPVAAPSSATSTQSATTYTTSTVCPSGYVASPSGSGPMTTLTAPVVSSYVVTSAIDTPQPGTMTSQPSQPAPQSTQQASTPDVLPRCLNTFESKCTSNTDSSCYCKDANFVTNVMQCVAAHANGVDDAGSAIAYLQGICAPQIPSNPAIVTACPSYITPKATAAPSTTTAAAGPSATSVTSPPASSATCPLTTIAYTGSSITTTLTVPQVSFASTGSAPAGLYYPSSTAAATSTAAPPYPTGGAYTQPSGTAASTGFVSYASSGTGYGSAPAAATSPPPTNLAAVYRGDAGLGGAQQGRAGAAMGVGVAAGMVLVLMV